MTQLEQEIVKKAAIVKEFRSSLVELERNMKAKAEILKYAEQYRDLRPYHIHYRSSKNPERYLQMHESELILYDGAKQMLQKAGMNPKTIDLDKLRASLADLEKRKGELQKKYRSAEKEHKQLNQQLSKLNQYLKQEKTQAYEKSTKGEPTR